MSTISLVRAVALFGIVLAGAPAWAQQVSQAAPGSQGTLQGFSVVLVLGDLQDVSTPDNIPAAARAAIGDLRDFLPYRSYRVLDTAWILGSTSQLFRGKSRLRGAEDQSYEVSFTSNPIGAPAPSLQVRFMMNEAGADAQKSADVQHREAQLRAEMMQLAATQAALVKQSQTSDPSESAEERRQRQAAIRAQIRDLEIGLDTRRNQLEGSRGGGAATLIDTTFNMRLGETVVVGTSRVRGDKALIALLTAVRK